MTCHPLPQTLASALECRILQFDSSAEDLVELVLVVQFVVAAAAVAVVLVAE